MLNFDVKRKINTLRDILVGKVPDPKAQVEQITIALIYKFMDDIDQQGADFGGTREFFKGEYEKYAFTQIMLAEHSAQDRLNLYAEGIEKMTNNPDLPKLFRDILRNAYIPYRDPETLNRFLKEIAAFSYEDSEELGNAFEYLLSIMGSQGDAGQFRTPRHIIDMMVEITAPAKNETILDPACGTAGFLISAYNYIKKTNLDEQGKSTLVAVDKTRMTRNFAGYDISPDMVRLSRVNMYLHGFTNPNISEYDTLTSLEKWDDTYDVIFSNPPFMTPKGGITPHSRYQVSAKRAEVLFVDYIAEHLNPTGRAAIIVPEGIVFQSQTAYKNLRKMLVDGNYLYGVISLPAGVFNPYSGVKTSILLLDRTIAKQRDSILFVKLNNDGFDLGAQRREIKGSDIPDVINIFKDYQKGVDVSSRENVVFAKKSDIADQEYILVSERYDIVDTPTSKWNTARLIDICLDIRNGANVEQKDNGKYLVTRIQTISDGTVNLEKTKHTDDEPQDIFFMQEGDILLSHINSYEHLAKSAIFPACSERVVHGINLVKIRPNKDRVIPKYLSACIKSEIFVNKARSFAQRAVNQASIKVSDLKEISIPLPPLTVQEEIVSEIENYQKIIDGACQVVENYKPTIKIDPAWEVKPLSELCEVITKGTTPTTYGFEFVDEGVSFIKIESITASGRIEKTRLAHITEECHSALKRSQLEKDDILFSIAGSMGIAAIVGDDVLPANTNQALSIIRMIDKSYVPYVFQYLRSTAIIQEIERIKVGVAQFNLSLKQVGEFNVPIPPKEKCADIVAKISEELAIVEQNKRLIEIFQQKIKDRIAEVWGE